ncbi:MAG: hydrolase [Rhizobiales bacterium 35-68-8]|nr:MAG: hydrolase [Rhizobiales bacterium 35-68-8]
MRGLKAILFDKDGTLVHFDRTWGPAAGAVMRALAGDDAAALRRLEEVSHYLPDEERFLFTSPLVAGSSAHYGPLWALALRQEASDAFLSRIDQLFSEEGLRHLTPVGQPRRVLADLKAAGLHIGIVTNDAEDNARLQSGALDLTPLLDAVIGYDSGFGSKPDPGMVTAFCRRFQLSAAEVAVVGDSAHDLSAARAAGSRFILVRTGPAPVDAMMDAADLVVDSIDDLTPALFGLAPAGEAPRC